VEYQRKLWERGDVVATLGVYPLLDREGARAAADQARAIALGRGDRVVVPPEAAQALGHGASVLPVQEWEEVDVALTLGGDGTLLAAATRLAPLGVPLLGVNLGRVGFLTELEVRDLAQGVEAALEGRLFAEERMMVEGEVWRGGERAGAFLALNDLVVTKGPFARLVRLQASVGGSPLGRYSADGLILATPTGSTAYALSAGGPVLSPDVDAILITPICPHSLDARSVVVPPETTVSLELSPMGDRTEVFLTVDGQKGMTLEVGDRIEVRRSDTRTRLLRHPDYDFLQVLRRKLSEGTL